MKGWEQALTDLVNARGSALKRYAYLLCGSNAEAEDLVQDALLRTFTYPRGSDIDALEAFVRKTILNRYLDRARRRTLWNRIFPRLGAPAQVPDDSGTIDDREEMRVALMALTPRQRACVVLHYYGDLPLPEIAHRLGCSPGAVKRNLHDGRLRLAAILGRS